MDSNSNSNSKTGVLLVSHGSRLPYGREVINKLADMYREESEYPVEVGFMEISEPNIPTALNTLIDANKDLNRIVVMPVFLAGGVHINHDIPKILGLDDHIEESDAAHSHGHSHGDGEDDHFHFDGEILYTEPLGADPLVLEIIKNRINGVLE